MACTSQPVVNNDMMRVPIALPADLSGSWERNYARDDDVNAVFRVAYNQLVRTVPDQMGPRGQPPVPSISARDLEALSALARLTELITRPDVLTITQSANEISVEREDDFALSCTFYNGTAKGISNGFGTEICGWNGEELVSHLVLPDGVQITHRFTLSPDREQLRVVTTASSNTSRVPFTLRRFYTKFYRPASEFNCIETLSMKRVCSTGEITP